MRDLVKMVSFHPAVTWRCSSISADRSSKGTDGREPTVVIPWLGGLRRAGVNWWHFRLRRWTVNWCVPPSAAVPLLPKQPIPTIRLRHRFTTFWRMGKAIHNFWWGRFTIWTPRFTTFLAGPPRNEKGDGDLAAEIAILTVAVAHRYVCRLSPLTITISRSLPSITQCHSIPRPPAIHPPRLLCLQHQDYGYFQHSVFGKVSQISDQKVLEER